MSMHAAGSRGGVVDPAQDYEEAGNTYFFDRSIEKYRRTGRL